MVGKVRWLGGWLAPRTNFSYFRLRRLVDFVRRRRVYVEPIAAPADLFGWHWFWNTSARAFFADWQKWGLLTALRNLRASW